MLWLASDMQLRTVEVKGLTKQPIHVPEVIHDRLRVVPVEQLNFANHLEKVKKFLKLRPVMEWADSRPDAIYRLILSEIEECLVEIQTISSSVNYSGKLNERIKTALLEVRNFPKQTEEQYSIDQFLRFYSEVYDLLVLVLDYASSNHLDMNFDRVYERINGQGNRSDVFDRFKLLAGGVFDSNPVAAIEEMMIILGSIVVHQEMQVDSTSIMQSVLNKNERNYPAEYFEAFHYIVSTEGKLTLVVLNRDEFGVAFNHRVRCLRLIRNALKLAKIDRSTGMLSDDHFKYKMLILNHRDENSFKLLAIDLVASLGKNGRQFTYNQLVAVESEPHRVVSGLKPTELHVKSGYRGEIVIAH